MSICMQNLKENLNIDHYNHTVLKCSLWADLRNLKYLPVIMSIFLPRKYLLLLWMPLLLLLFSFGIMLFQQTIFCFLVEEDHLLKKKTPVTQVQPPRASSPTFGIALNIRLSYLFLLDFILTLCCSFHNYYLLCFCLIPFLDYHQVL